MPTLSASAFAADPGHAVRDITLAQTAGADSLHIDVMDGHLVTLFGLGTQWLDAMRPHISVPLDVHLMTHAPERFIPQFAAYRPTAIVFHPEGRDRRDNQAGLTLIRSHGIRCGLAVSPVTAIGDLVPYLDMVDDILVMGTEPGQPGSVYVPETPNRVNNVRERLAGRPVRLSVDGGLTADTALACIAAGADNVIMGRAFFTDPDPAAVAARIHAAAPRFAVSGI